MYLHGCACVHTRRPKEDAGHPPLSLSACSFEVRSSSEPGTHIFLSRPETSKLQRPSVLNHLRAEITSVYRYLALLYGCCNVNLRPHNCSASVLDHIAISLDPVWNFFMSYYDLHRFQHCPYLLWSKKAAKMQNTG